MKRVVDTEFWNDDKIVELFSPEDKLFFLYLMTNPHTTQLGIYHINKKQMAFELGYSVETVNTLLNRFQNKYRIAMYSEKTSEIAIKNYLRHSIVKGGKPVEDLLLKEIEKVKDRSLFDYIVENLEKADNLNETVKEILPKMPITNTLLNTNNITNNILDNTNNVLNNINYKCMNNNENENDVSYHDSSNDSSNDSSKKKEEPLYDEEIAEIVRYFNQTTGSKRTLENKAVNNRIRARLKEGYTVDDLKAVINKKWEEWKGTEFEKYVQPETMFAPSHFEQYLNQATKKKGRAF